MTKSKKLTIRLGLGTCVIAIGSMSMAILPTKVQAAVYKCTDANGAVSYNQVPCVSVTQTETVLTTKTPKKANVDCRIANNFARKIATGMRMGQGSREVFDSYGGIDALPSTSVGIISYVYSHKGNVKTGAQRITALSAARCSAGSYGPVSCEDFPYEFIAELGGCERALMNITPNPQAVAPSEKSEPQKPEGTTQALGARTIDDQAIKSDNCKNNVQAQLSELFEQMRTGQSASEQGQLEDRKKQLRQQLSGC